ncbi:MAG: hypothetical protein H6Q75_1686 [Firmicutes bacterium]|nr:hypothetical protein [Bacillota bacterium]
MAGRRGATKPVAKKPVKKSPEKEPVKTPVPEKEPEKVEIPENKQPESLKSIAEEFERHTLQACRSYAKAVDLVIGKMRHVRR